MRSVYSMRPSCWFQRPISLFASSDIQFGGVRRAHFVEPKNWTAHEIHTYGGLLHMMTSSTSSRRGNIISDQIVSQVGLKNIYHVINISGENIIISNMFLMIVCVCVSLSMHTKWMHDQSTASFAFATQFGRTRFGLRRSQTMANKNRIICSFGFFISVPAVVAVRTTCWDDVMLSFGSHRPPSMPSQAHTHKYTLRNQIEWIRWRSGGDEREKKCRGQNKQ